MDQKGQISNSFGSDLKRLIRFIYKFKPYLKENIKPGFRTLLLNKTMAITHKFINDLNEVEENQSFSREAIDKKSKILFVGTFNPDSESCMKENNATWFYGRNQNKFWRYMPNALTRNLHGLDGNFNLPQDWKDYCVTNKLVIIDLVKSIEVDDVLENFGDRQVDCKINHL